jgi:cytochrome c
MKVLPFGFLALLVGLDPAAAAEKGTVDRGELLLRTNCSRCHAIGTTGNSPHPEAPPFRTLSSRYPIEDLSESLAEGIVSGPSRHADLRVQRGRCRGDHRIS